MRNRQHVLRVFYASLIGIVLSLIIRGKFDGIALLCVIIAVISFFTHAHLTAKDIHEGRR